jgi:predicted GIY-YIG superfamily endonuclease
MDAEWFFYLIKNNNCTYAGVSPTPDKRLRQHNGEIKGGAKYTTSKGPGWEHICLIGGFQDKIQSMQFEWAVKHVPPRDAGGVENRIKKMLIVCNKERWTSKAPLAKDVPLTIYWKSNVETSVALPEYIKEMY